MTKLDISHDLMDKVKASEYWRDDFKIVGVKDAGGIPLYEISADDQEPQTILAILQLNNILQES